MAFLKKGYKEPDESNYMKLKQGENRFRVLSDTITGMEYWKDVEDDQGKIKSTPVRKRQGEVINIKDLRVDKDGSLEMPKHFWAFVVWNYDSEKVQILEITQTTIRRPMMKYYANKAWGDPREYDIVVSKEGEGLKTEYTVMPSPKSKIDEGIKRMAKDMNINLEALFSGGDPFNREGSEKVKAGDIPQELGE